jgi:hypothetical protein
MQGRPALHASGLQQSQVLARFLGASSVRLRFARRTHAIDDLVSGTALAAGDSKQTGG